MPPTNTTAKSLEPWIRDAGGSTRGVKDASRFCCSSRLWTLGRVVANPVGNQGEDTGADNDELDRIAAGAGFPGRFSTDLAVAEACEAAPALREILWKIMV